MRVAVTADIHIGNHSAFAGETWGRMNARCQKILSLLEEAIEVAVLEGCEVFVVAGDVFDNDNPFPDQLAALLAICDRWRARIRLVFMVGNHDQHSTEPNDHALAPLRFMVEVVETPKVLNGAPSVLLVPYGYDAETLEQRAPVVIAHHGIADASTHPAKAAGKGVKNAGALQSWMVKTGVRLYLAGDWHEHRVWEPGVIQIGALSPVNWTNRAYLPTRPDPYGSVVIFDHRLEWERRVIRGPRFMKASSIEEARLLKSRSEEAGVIPYIDLEEVQEQELPEDLHGTVRPPSVVKQREEAVGRAALRIREGATQEEAVATWVASSASIPDDLKEEVAEKAKQFLRRASKC